MTDAVFTYMAGRLGCSWLAKIGSSTDPARRVRSLRETRTLSPPAVWGRPVILLAAWLGPPLEADLLHDLGEFRWHTRTGRATEYVLIRPPVAALLDARCADWRDLLACDPATLRPIRTYAEQP